MAERETASGDPLLTTKLTIPPARSVLVPRPQLVARLHAGLHGPLTLLSAPAGSGKTTLLSAWRNTWEGQETALAWVALDAGDNEPARFWRYVLTALDRAVPGVAAAALTLLDSSGLTDVVLIALVNSLAGQETDVVLILDDYHLIETEAIHRMLAALLERRPPSLHLLLATRADPSLPLARLRARGEVTELRVGDLRFTVEETAAFLTTVMGLSLSTDAVAALEARTEGWIAGLQLAGLSLQGRSAEDAAGFIQALTGSHRYIVDYLLDEVLLRQPEEVQRFLLHTCILDRMCASLCASVLEGEQPSAECVAQSQAILETLERNNVFLIALDDARYWYRYHYLFADALRQRQRGHPSISDVSVLHRRASAWFERQDLVEEAIGHAITGGSYDVAAGLMPRARRPLAFRGKPQGLTAWYRALPEPMLQERPDLSLQYAWILIEMRDLRRAEEYLHHAEIALEASPNTDSADEWVARQGVIKADRALISVMRGDADGAIARGQAVLDSPLGDGSRSGSITAVMARSIAGFALGIAHLRQGGAKEAADAFRSAAREVADAISNVDVNRPADTAPFYGAFLAAAGEVSAHRLAGDLDSARIAYEKAIRWSEDHSHMWLLAGNLYTGLADILRERNELDAALDLAGHGIRLEQQLGVAGSERWIEWNVCNLLALARIKQAQGDLEGALATIHEAQTLLQGTNATTFSAILAACEAQLHLAQGDLQAAVRWLETSERHEAPARSGLTPPVFVYTTELLEIAPIQVLIARGRVASDPAHIHRAITLLDRLQERADRSELTWFQVKTRILQALAQDLRGERDAAMVALRQALDLAQPQGYVRVFADEGMPVAELLRQVHARSAGPDHAATLLQVLETSVAKDAPGAGRPSGGAPRTFASIEPLTERERDVLRLLATGRSNPEIARALYVELNTVKTHVKSLYAKLGVHSRVEAVHRARELALL